MYPDLEILIPLQALDVEARRLREQMAAAPRRVVAAKLAAEQAAKTLAANAAEIAREETLRRRQESDTADLRTKLDRTRKKIDAATTTGQVAALEHEISFALAEIARLEDAEIESMERSETLEAARTSLQAARTAQDHALEQERIRSEQLVHKDRIALAEVERQIARLRAELLARETGEASLDRYDRLTKSRGTAVSEASLGKCTACGMMVRPQLWHELRDNSPDSPTHESLVSCENCSRLLYYDPARDAPQRKPVQGESIAASIVRNSL
jgi:predicted  nucleic acid-binding Zn-ribbon protein